MRRQDATTTREDSRKTKNKRRQPKGDPVEDTDNGISLRRRVWISGLWGGKNVQRLAIQSRVPDAAEQSDDLTHRQSAFLAFAAGGDYSVCATTTIGK